MAVVVMAVAVVMGDMDRVEGRGQGVVCSE